MENSKIKDHKQVKKQLITPWNYLLGDKLSLNSWYKERSPEYLWIAAIIDHYGRKKGLLICNYIINYILDNSLELESLGLSCLLKLNDEKLYDYILSLVDCELLDPLCIVCRDNELFRKKFYVLKNTNSKRITILKKYVELVMNGYSELSTDIRFIIVYYLSAKGKLYFLEGMEAVDALKEYYYLEHSDERMKLYRSSIRSLEGNTFMMYKDLDYINYFWYTIGSVSDCDISYIDYKEVSDLNMKDYLDILKKQISLLVYNHSEEYNNTKLSVISSTYVYCLKLLNEIDKKDMYLNISSRIILRTIIDCYINIKYILTLENENKNIWNEFIEDGLGKYKLINMKARECLNDEKSHITYPVLDALANEIKDEEFLNINLGFFKGTQIRERFDKVGEKDLYNILYDYDVQFSHGHWGAIRESATTICSNPLHENHFLADVEFDTKCASTKNDLIKVMNKFSKVINQNYPEFELKELKKYGL